MENKLSAEDVLLALYDEATTSLEELQAVQDEDGGPTNQFVDGEKSALVVCLEFIMKWQKAKERGLEFDVEGTFPV